MIIKKVDKVVFKSDLWFDGIEEEIPLDKWLKNPYIAIKYDYDDTLKYDLHIQWEKAYKKAKNAIRARVYRQAKKENKKVCGYIGGLKCYLVSHM